MRHGDYHHRGLLRRENWGRYAAGILTEAVFILALTGLALLMAVVSLAVYG